MSDQEITCAECGSAFLFREAEQQFYAERGLAAPPKRCKPCRQARKAQADGGGGGHDARPPRGGDRGGPRFNDRGPGGASNGRPPFRQGGGFGNGAPPRAGFGASPRPGGFGNGGPPRGDRPGFNGGAPRGDRPVFGGPPRGDRGGLGGDAPRGDRGGFNGGAPRFNAPSRGGFGATSPRGDRGPRPNGFGPPGPPRESSWGTRPTDSGNRPPRPARARDESRDAAPQNAPDQPRAARARPERPKFDITCAECGTQSQVPFKPLEGRQVFCQPCYKARKGTATTPETAGNDEVDSGIVE